MGEGGRLPAHRFGDGRMGVPKRGHRQAADEVEVAAALGVEEDRSLAAHESHRRLGVRPHEEATVGHGSTIVPTPRR